MGCKEVAHADTLVTVTFSNQYVDTWGIRLGDFIGFGMRGWQAVPSVNRAAQLPY